MVHFSLMGFIGLAMVCSAAYCAIGASILNYGMAFIHDVGRRFDQDFQRMAMEDTRRVLEMRLAQAAVILAWPAVALMLIKQQIARSHMAAHFQQM